MTQTVLHIDASARSKGSATRDMSRKIVDALTAERVIRRDLAAAPLPQVDETWVAATFTPKDQRSGLQNDALGLSDTLVDELERADTIVIGTPIYNFTAPAALKAWIDQVARVGRTFEYTAEGARGLLSDKSVIVAIASGGTTLGSDIDFATPYLRHIMGFLGLTDVSIVTQDDIETFVQRAA